MTKIYFLFILIPFLVNAQLDQRFFNTIKNEKAVSNALIEWKNFDSGMSGLNEKFWYHPIDTNVMFMGPDMSVAYGTCDNGKSWQTIKDSDGFGKDLARVLDIVFSTQNPDFGLALERRGKVFETNNTLLITIYFQF